MLFSSRQIRQLFESVGLTDIRFVVREYPFLCSLYADWRWNWPMTVRDSLARRSWFNLFGIVCFAFGTKPSTALAAEDLHA
jgi:hypothetical protein